ncbi:MAG: hypothetical protein QM485_15085 [Flavobacteriaceae bacterium]
MRSSLYTVVLLAFLIFSSCKKDDVDTVILRSTEYQLSNVGGSGVTGTATFTEDSNGTTEVLIELEGSSTAENPAFIRFNSASEGGSIALTLKSCECSVSHTVVSKLDDGTTISYDGLLKLDGHVSIHGGENNSEIIVSVTNIGANAN